MSDANLSGFNEAECMHGFYAFRSAGDEITLGFMVRSAQSAQAERTLGQEAMESVLGLIHCWAERTNNQARIEEIDFDLCGQGRISVLLGEHSLGLTDAHKGFLMLADDTGFHDTIAKLISASKLGEPPALLLDFVADQEGELKLLEFFDELTGEMS